MSAARRPTSPTFVRLAWQVVDQPLAAVLFAWTKLVFATVTTTVEGGPLPDAGPAIYANWHRHSVVLCVHHGEFGRWLMASPAPYLSAVRRLARWLGLRLVEGTSHDGGQEALDALAEQLVAGESVVLAVDGPRGPAFRAKRGCFVLAQRSGAPIVPVAYVARSNRTLHSRWDRMRWIRFFDRLDIRYGRPIWIADRPFNEVLAELEDALHALDPETRALVAAR